MYFPRVCAEDGDDCECPNKVLYGARYKSETHQTEAQNDPHHDHKDYGQDARTVLRQWNDYKYAVNDWNNTNSKCSKENFEGVDPLPHMHKHCYCDYEDTAIESNYAYYYWKRIFTDTKARSVKAYWRSIMRERELEEERIRAEKLAEEARREAEEKKKEEERRKKEEEERRRKEREE